MKFPWTRIRDERTKREQAERDLAATEADWQHINVVRRELRAAYGPNGWTGIAAMLFASRKEPPRDT